MTYTQSDLDAIKQAIASGELEVAYSDKKVKYRSINELIKAKNMIEKELAAESGTRPARMYRVNVSKGI